MAMSFKSSPQILQRIMNKIFEDNIGKGIEVYMYDIVIHRKQERDMIVCLDKL